MRSQVPSENSNTRVDSGIHLSGKDLMQFLKKQDCPPDESFSIKIRNTPPVRLRMVSTINPKEDDIINLSEWRNRYVRSFLTEFEATPQRTRTWITQAVAQDLSRILFMIEEPGLPPLGYIGLAFIDYDRQTAEADSVVRGNTGHPGTMARALQTLIEWSQDSLGIKKIGVRVLSDNPALAFYEKFGFREVERVPLQREASPVFVSWKEVIGKVDPRAEIRWLVHMELPSI
jgi:RimJ/RimL family protein N-acetyltransferase